MPEKRQNWEPNHAKKFWSEKKILLNSVHASDAV